MKSFQKKKKYIMFDIDGTLLRALAAPEAMKRFDYAIKKVFDKDVTLDFAHFNTHFNGMGDRGIFMHLLKDQNVTLDQFESKLPEIENIFIQYLNTLSKEKKLYERIEDAYTLFTMVHKDPDLVLGTLTGNLGKGALWKLKHVNIPTDQFMVSVYGHEATMRNDLAKLVIPKIIALYNTSPDPEDIIFIGDTTHDILCAKAIGAKVIIVTTGWNTNREELLSLHPDLVVDTLLDPKVLHLLGLEK